MGQILIVDSHALMRKITGVFVSNIGYQPLFAFNGVEAISALQTHPEIKLILLDVNVFAMDEVELIRENLPGRKELPIIIMSAESDKKLIKQVKNLKVSGWIAKPIDETILKKCVDALLK